MTRPFRKVARAFGCFTSALKFVTCDHLSRHGLTSAVRQPGATSIPITLDYWVDSVYQEIQLWRLLYSQQSDCRHLSPATLKQSWCRASVRRTLDLRRLVEMRPLCAGDRIPAHLHPVMDHSRETSTARELWKGRGSWRCGRETTQSPQNRLRRKRNRRQRKQNMIDC